jgi:hypothetical protein
MKIVSVPMRCVAAAVLLAALVGSQPGTPSAGAAGPAPGFPAAELRPLGELLNPDGSLNTAAGYRGALDPAGYWRFDEGGGDSAADSGAGNHPGLVYGATWTASPAPTAFNNPYALHFDGIDDKVEVAGLTQCAPFSVSAWIKADAWQAGSYEGTIVGQDSGEGGGSQGFALRAGEGGRLNFVVAAPIDGEGWPDAVTDPVMQVGRWHHVAGTYDGATERAYIDGQELTSRPVGATFYPSTYPLRIGYGSIISSRTFTGAIDDVRYYCKALSPEEVRDLATRRRIYLPLVM